MKRNEWSKHIEDWKCSGREAADYGKQYGIDPKKLYWWSWFLRKHRTPAARPATKVALVPMAPTALLPVKVRQSAAPADSRAPAHASGAAVEIALPGGAIIRAASSVDPVWLGRVIASGTASC